MSVFRLRAILTCSSSDYILSWPLCVLHNNPELLWVCYQWANQQDQMKCQSHKLCIKQSMPSKDRQCQYQIWTPSELQRWRQQIQTLKYNREIPIQEDIEENSMHLACTLRTICHDVHNMQWGQLQHATLFLDTKYVYKFVICSDWLKFRHHGWCLSSNIYPI